MSSVFVMQKAKAELLRGSSSSDRKKKLKRLWQSIRAHEQDVIKAAFEDSKKPEAEVLIGELAPVYLELRDAIKNLSLWMQPKSAGSSLMLPGSKAEVRIEPKGQCLILSPWNFPFSLSMCPLVSAVAAGNTVIIKPSEYTPAMAAVIVSIITECFDEDEVSVCLGDADQSQSLLQNPFNHIFFTGSPSVGKLVMQAAAQHLSSVTLELGGKSPTVIFPDADLAQAANRIVSGKFLNCGQICLAPDHVYVPRSLHEEFTGHLCKEIKQRYGDITQSKDYARIIHDRHYRHLVSMLEKSQLDGAKVRWGGERDPRVCLLGPTILTNVSEQNCIMSDEIFGPILPILVYDNISDVISAVNRRPAPLASYLFGHQRQPMLDFMKKTQAGGSCINQVVLHYAHQGLPFGGINASGIGRAKGYAGFLGFSNERAILDAHLLPDNPLKPPYSLVLQRLTRWGYRLLERI